MEDKSFVAKVLRGLKRDRNIGLSHLLRRGASLATQSAMAKAVLRRCTRVGAGARVIGRARIENRGSIVVGTNFSLNGGFLPVELLTGPDGRITIGDAVWINFGCVVAARTSVTIGARTHIGPHCVVADLDLPEACLDGEPASVGEAKPVEIGEGAWLAGRVTVTPGSKIGAGSVITAGSIVQGEIPPNVIAGGIPARVLKAVGAPAEANGAAGASHTASKTNGASNGAATAAVAPAPRPPRFAGTLISDFTIDELGDVLAGDDDPVLASTIAPFGQVTQALLQGPSAGAADFGVVWTRIESALPSFARLLAYETVDDETLLAEVDAFAKLLERGAAGYRFLFVPTWVLPPWVRGWGVLEGRPGGAYRALLLANARLMKDLAEVSNVFVLNAERWFTAKGLPSSNHRAWFMGKMAAPRAVLAEAAHDIKAALAGLTGGARKLVVVDLDDTLWGGIVGDVGWEALRLGGHDPEGEAFVEFQRALKSLKQRGIVLGIVSKNEESVALEAIRSHPEMVLKEADFVGHKINWFDKARNIAELAQKLNLGLQSVVFIDDNPVERARVREALPEVLVPEWPVDKLLYPSALSSLGCFDAPSLSREDLQRTQMYAEEQQRDALQKQVGSIEEWLMTLGLKVKAEPLKAVNLARSAQLLNKTNQLNLTTRRLSEAELLAWTREPNRHLWAVTVADRFGDAGLTGLVSIEREGDVARVVDYVLSCRVMGRKVEETMVHLAATAARELGARVLRADYLPTAKNKPCLTFWQASGFANSGDREFTWDLTQPYALPAPIHLSWER